MVSNSLSLSMSAILPQRTVSSSRHARTADYFSWQPSSLSCFQVFRSGIRNIIDAFSLERDHSSRLNDVFFKAVLIS